MWYTLQVAIGGKGDSERRKMVEAYKIRAKALKDRMGTPPRPMWDCHALTAKFAAGLVASLRESLEEVFA